MRAATAGWRRSLSRQRARLGPMLPTGLPSMVLIPAYGSGGSSMSRASSRLQQGADPETPGAALRFARPSVVHLPPCCSGYPGDSRGPMSAGRPEVALRGGTGGIPGGWWWLASRAARLGHEVCPDDPRAAATHSGRRRRASVPFRRYRRQMDHTNGAYRSTRVSHAWWSPALARVTRSETDESSRIPVTSTLV
jgi:hypothetical protein